MPTDMVLSFDTTGSMHSILMQVRRKVAELVRVLFASVPDLRVGVIVHGDYCDQGSSYLSKVFDLSSDREGIVNFIQTAGVTSGGSWEEAYDHVLREARILSWLAGSRRALVMVGDAHCHPRSSWGTKEGGFLINPKKIDWENECRVLNDELGVRVFGVHALSQYNQRSREFWQGMAKLTGGKYLTLDQFPEVVSLLRLLFLHQSGEEGLLPQFVNELVADQQMTAGIADTVEVLTGSRPTVTKSSLGGGHRTTSSTRPRTSAVSGADLSAYGEVSLEPVAAGRFQLLDVDKKTSIKEFVEEAVGEGVFKKGAGFYELGKKSVEVQEYKEVVLIDKASGELWSGLAARKMLGLPKNGTFVLNPKERNVADFLKRYQVFIQSTSVNRALLQGDQFLYEVADLEVRA
jgi:hypothetical protein